MTAETLKPFITPTSDSFPTTHSTMSTPSPSGSRRQLARSSSLPLMISIMAGLLAAAVLIFAILNMFRIHKLESDLQNLNKVVDGMRDRLGLKHLDDFNEFEKEYNKAFIDNGDFDQDKDYVLPPDNDDEYKKKITMDNDDDDDDNDDDDDDEDDDYSPTSFNGSDDDNGGGAEEWIKRFNNYDDPEGGDDYDEEARNSSDDDNLYDDFEKFKDSKNKKREQQGTRKSRSIQGVSSDMALLENSSIASVLLVKNKTHTDNNKNNNNDNNNNDDDDNAPNQKNNSHVAALSAATPTPSRAPSTSRKVKQSSSDSTFISSHRPEEHFKSLLRQRSHRRRQHKSAEVKRGFYLAPYNPSKIQTPKYSIEENSRISAKLRPRSTEDNPVRPAAHFHLNRKIPDIHTNFKVDSFSGDMYIGQQSWSNEIPFERYFSVDQGVLTVHEAGLYYVYAQVCYNNSHDQNGFVIFHGQRPFLQCLNTVPTNMHKIHTCHTSGLVYLQADETIHLRDFHADRNVILKEANNRSYFGIIKM